MGGNHRVFPEGRFYALQRIDMGLSLPRNPQCVDFRFFYVQGGNTRNSVEKTQPA